MKLVHWAAALLTFSWAAEAQQIERLTAKIWNADGRGHIQVGGGAREFPEGTRLRFEVRVAGGGPAPVVAAFFRAEVVGAEFAYVTQRSAPFPPLTYEVRVQVQVRGQPPLARQQLQQSFDWSERHIQSLGQRTVQLGTAEEAAALRRRVLLRIRAQVDDLYPLHEALTAGVRSPASWEELRPTFRSGLVAVARNLRALEAEWAVLPDPHLAAQERKCLDKLSTITMDFEANKAAPATLTRDLGRLRQWLDVLYAEVNGLLPLDERRSPPEAGLQDVRSDVEKTPDDLAPEDEPAGAAAAEPEAPLRPKVLVVERVIDAPVAEVWAAFTDPEVMRAWMAPHVEVELKVGGAIKTNYDPEGEIGDPKTIVNTILCYDPQRMLALQNAKAPADFPFAEGTVGTWSVTYFTALEGGTTRVKLVGLGWPDTEAGAKAYAFFERGNAYSLELLAKHLAGEAVTTPESDGSDVPGREE